MQIAQICRNSTEQNNTDAVSTVKQYEQYGEAAGSHTCKTNTSSPDVMHQRNAEKEEPLWAHSGSGMCVVGGGVPFSSTQERIREEGQHCPSESLMETHEEAELCFPELLNASCLKPVVSQTNALVYQILLFIFSPLTVALNLVVIISVAHFRQLHTPTNLLLLSLAVSDLLVGLVLMPVEVLRKMTCWFLGDSMCSLYIFFAWLSVSASVGDMVLISVDRYVAICDPLHYTNKVTMKRVKVCICLCWFCSCCYCFVILNDDLTQSGKYPICQGQCVIIYDFVASAIDLVATFILPISAIIALYMSVFVVAVSQARAMRSHITSITAQRSGKAVANKSELKAARSLGILVVVFLICFCPYYIVSLTGNSFIPSLPFYMTYVMYLNSCVNPLIYSLFYPWFRKAVRLIFTLQILQSDSCDSTMV
ncbi:trace amine-associated receptor 13c-like [Sphaeramia orbicularis]|uniref:trace amine-associated receptor 13c-like n=1 Tax=Sphaeramia orbicularis TaxID=375764 RepID=UPI00117EB682|nr:trace amine-associated receptor 13c-like [Sphaeramia orbicularis]